MVEKFEMAPHPEGGYYKELVRSEGNEYTVCLYMITGHKKSIWRKLAYDEIVNFYEGAPIHIDVCYDRKTIETVTLGKNYEEGNKPVFVIPKNQWARFGSSTGEFSFVAVNVVPAFQWDKFWLSEEDWDPLNLPTAKDKFKYIRNKMCPNLVQKIEK